MRSINEQVSAQQTMVAYWTVDLKCVFASARYRRIINEGVRSVNELDEISHKRGAAIAELIGAGTKKQIVERVESIVSNDVQYMLQVRVEADEDGAELVGYIEQWKELKKDEKINGNTPKDDVPTKSLLAAILQSSTEAIISKRQDGTILTWNKGAEQVLGYSEAEAIGQHISMLFEEQRKAEERALTEQVLGGAKVEQYETKRVRKDGVVIDVSITLSPIYNEAGELIAISKVLRDISVQKQAERIANESYERSLIFVQQAPNAIAMLDREMRYLAASEQWIKDYKLEGKEVIGVSHYEVFPEIGDDWKAIHQKCLAGGVDKNDAAPFERADGSMQWLKWDVRPWYKSKGEIGGIMMYTADITDFVNRQSEQRKNQFILEKSGELAQIASWEVDTKTGSAKWSPAATSIYEVAEDFDLNIKNVLPMYVPGPELDKLLEAVECASKYGTPYDVEVPILTPNGNKKWLRIVGEAIMEQGVYAKRYGLLQNITKSKEAAEQLKAAKDELESILNAGNVSIISTDSQGIITHFSKGAEQLLGYSAEEMVGINSPVLIHHLPEVEDRGKELTEIMGAPVAGFEVFVARAKAGIVECREWTYVRKDKSLVPVQLAVTAMRDRDGIIVGYVGVATDISNLKKAEQETIALLEISTDQNKRLTNFAHIVSHNLRAHSGNIKSLMDLMLMEQPELHNNEYISLLRIASQNLTETIAGLTEIVQITATTKDKLHAVNIAERTTLAITSVQQMAMDKQTVIEANIDPALEVMGLPAYVDSILFNLISNGIKYRDSKKESKVSVQASSRGNYVELNISDNGIGIDLNRYGSALFGMYKTFHGNNDARGLGLFITKNQVEAMGGIIEVKSTPGIGTSFAVRLPQA